MINLELTFNFMLPLIKGYTYIIDQIGQVADYSWCSPLQSVGYGAYSPGGLLCWCDPVATGDRTRRREVDRRGIECITSGIVTSFTLRTCFYGELPRSLGPEVFSRLRHGVAWPFHMDIRQALRLPWDHDLARHRAGRERGTELAPRHQAGPGCSRLRPAAESYSHVRLDSSDQDLGLSVYAGVARHYNMQREAVLGGEWFAILRIYNQHVALQRFRYRD